MHYVMHKYKKNLAIQQRYTEWEIESFKRNVSDWLDIFEKTKYSRFTQERDRFIHVDELIT